MNNEQKLKAAKILERAARIIKGHWIQGKLHDANATHCALGGIEVASEEEEIEIVANRANSSKFDIYTCTGVAGYARQCLLRTIRQHFKYPYPDRYHHRRWASVDDFNDDANTTERDVVRMMKLAAREIRKEIGAPKYKEIKTKDSSKYFFKNEQQSVSTKAAS